MEFAVYPMASISYRPEVDVLSVLSPDSLGRLRTQLEARDAGGRRQELQEVEGGGCRG